MTSVIPSKTVFCWAAVASSSEVVGLVLPRGVGPVFGQVSRRSATWAEYRSRVGMQCGTEPRD